MGKAIEIKFSLGAVIGGSFTGAFKTAQQAAQNVTASIRQMENSATGKLGRQMASQREKIRNLSASLKDARSTLAGLKSQESASGAATGMLARQIELADQKVRNLSESLKRQNSIWLKSVAQARTASGSIRKITQEYAALGANMDRQKNLSAALSVNRANSAALSSQRSDLHSRMAGAVATTASIAIPAKLSIDFEQAIANVGAVANATDEDMQRLTATARQLGRDTMFSASEAAEGMKYLAMAGFDTNRTIAAMPGLLNLAAAADADLGRASDIASDILTAFGMKAEEMGDVADTLTKAFTTSNTDLEKLGDTMKYVAPAAHGLGMSLQETSAYAGLMANTGIKASQGGTVLRAALLRLAAPPKMAADSLAALAGMEGEEAEELKNLLETMGGMDSALAEMGMSTKDAAGNMRPFADIIEELNLRTAKMGSAEKAEVFKKVFGSEAYSGMAALAEQAAKTVDEHGKAYTDALGNQTTALRSYLSKINNFSGTAEEIAKKRMDTTKGSLLLLSSAWQDAGISIGNLFLPAIRACAGMLSTVANAISGFTEKFPRLSKGVALAAGGFALVSVGAVALGFALNIVKTSLNSLRGAFLRVSAAQIPATASTAAFGAASTAAGAGARFFAGGLRSVLAATGVGALLVGLGYAVSLLIDHWDEVVGAMKYAWNQVTETWGRLTIFFTELGNNLLAVFGTSWDEICGLANDAKEFVISAWNDLTGFFSGLWESVTATFTNGWNNIAAGATWLWNEVTGIWNGAAEFFSGIVNAISGVFSGLFDWLKEKFAWVFSAIGGISSFVGSITGAVGKAWDAAFGESSAKAVEEVVEKPVAEGTKEGVASGVNQTAKQPAVFTPVSKAAVDASSRGSAKAAMGKKAGAGRAGGGRSASSASGASSGPVTVVTLGGDNSKPITTFIPAGSTGGRSVSAVSGVMAKPAPDYAISRYDNFSRNRKSGQPAAGQQGGVNFTQNFDIITSDPATFKKVMESLRPDFEALVRRALAKIASDRARTAYSQ